MIDVRDLFKYRSFIGVSNGSGGSSGGSSGGGGSGGGSTEEWIGDGNTHIWITLAEGRTSPMLGVCPNGTVTVDWGDGTEPDTLTGTSTSTVKWTPAHNYAEPGDYVITLTVDGEMGFYGVNTSNQFSYLLRHGFSNDSRNRTYQAAVKKIEIGSGATSIGSNAFANCAALTSIVISEGVTSIGSYAFNYCGSLSSIVIPEGVTSIGTYAFAYCYALSSVVISDSVTSIGNSAFSGCTVLQSVVIPDSVTSIGNSAFSGCTALSSIVIPDSVTSIGTNTFSSCSGLRYCEFAEHTAVPTLPSTNAFSGISADCEIRVPAALADEWKAATNWATYASQIVAV